jgi:hypothetical protein
MFNIFLLAYLDLHNVLGVMTTQVFFPYFNLAISLTDELKELLIYYGY